jgi:hypothetical protein
MIMIEIALLSAGMSVLGYSFYHTIAVATANSSRIPAAWKGHIKMGAGLLLAMFFLYGMVFFNMVSVFSMGQELMKIVLSSVFLAGSFIAIIIVRISSEGLRNLSESSERIKKLYEDTSKAKEGLEKQVSELSKEVEVNKKIAKHAVGRELRMVELKKEIQDLKSRQKKK